MENSAHNKIARNTVFLTGAYIFQKILTFFYFAYLSRHLGSTNIGKYVWALSFAGIFALFIEFGLGPVLTREIARDYQKAKAYLTNVVSLKIIFSLITVVALIVAVHLLGRDARTINLVYLSSVIIVLDSFTYSFYSIFRAYQKLHYEAIGIIIYQTLIVTLGVLSISLGLLLKAVVIAILVGSIFNFCYSLSLVLFKAKIKLKFTFDKEIVKTILKIALPFAIAGIFAKLNNEIDKVLLGVLAGDRYVGWYSIASKFNISLTFIPGAFAMSFFPAMSRYFISSREKLAHTFETAVVYLTVVSLPIMAGCLILGDKIILKLYGPAFEASISAFKIIIFALIFIFINYPVGNLLNACNKQTINTINMGIATLLNIILNIFLIPRYTYIGASISALVSAVVLVALGIPWVGKVAPYRLNYIFGKFIKILLASGAMGILIYLMRDDTSLLLLIPAGLVIYLILLFALRIVTKKDLIYFYQSVFKKQNEENAVNYR